MKLYMYTHWSKEHECSAQIIFDDHEPEVFTASMLRACKQAELSKVKDAKRLTKLVFLGIYDDEAMKFEVTSEPVLLIDFDDLIEKREVATAKKEELKNV